MQGEITHGVIGFAVRQQFVVSVKNKQANSFFPNVITSRYRYENPTRAVDIDSEASKFLSSFYEGMHHQHSCFRDCITVFEIKTVEMINKHTNICSVWVAFENITSRNKNLKTIICVSSSQSRELL